MESLKKVIEEPKTYLFKNQDDEIIQKDIVSNKFLPQINENIKIIMECSGNIDDLEDPFSFFISFCKDNDYILPKELLLKLLYLIPKCYNTKYFPLILKFIQMTTAFDSPMPLFYVANNILEILFPYFPNEEVIKIFSNLSISVLDARRQLLHQNIIQFILENINDEGHFECLVHLTQSLLYYMEGFSYDGYCQDFIKLFHFFYSKIIQEDTKHMGMIVFAIRDYVEADNLFLEDFLNQNILTFLLSQESSLQKKKLARNILKICCIIADMKQSKGVFYLLNNNILEWTSNVIFIDNEDVRSNSFIFLSNIIDYDPNIADKLVNLDFHTISISEFSRECSYKYEYDVYIFLCNLFLHSNSDCFFELIQCNVFQLLIDYLELLDQEEYWNLLFDCVAKVKSVSDIDPQFKYLLDYAFYEVEFVNLLDEACKSDDDNIVSSAERLYLFFLDHYNDIYPDNNSL